MAVTCAMAGAHDTAKQAESGKPVQNSLDRSQKRGPFSTLGIVGRVDKQCRGMIGKASSRFSKGCVIVIQ